MAYALVTSDSKSGTSTGVTTNGVDTSGANLIVVSAGYYYLSGVTTPTISDSKSNSYTALTPQFNTSFGIRNQTWYVYAPTVGSSHTITLDGGGASFYVSVVVMAFSGAAASPLDQENGASGNGISSLATGSVTPSEDNELIISGLGHETNAGGAVTVNQSMTALTVAYVGGTSEGVGLAYKIQTTATAINPTWDITNNSGIAVTIATFKAAAGGAVGQPTDSRSHQVPWMNQGGGLVGRGGGRVFG